MDQTILEIITALPALLIPLLSVSPLMFATICDSIGAQLKTTEVQWSLLDLACINCLFSHSPDTQAKPV